MASSFILRDIFGEDCVSVKDGSVLSVTVDGKTANINLETRVSSCTFPHLRTFGKPSKLSICRDVSQRFSGEVKQTLDVQEVNVRCMPYICHHCSSVKIELCSQSGVEVPLSSPRLREK